MLAETAIANLLYTYAERIDAGDLTGAAALFDRAAIKLAEGHETDAAGLLSIWRARIVLYPCGTPRTKHVVTNPIIEVDEAAGTATCRSTYTVLQQVGSGPVQIIAAGRYHDSFRCEAGTWHFAARDLSLFDMAGELGQHLR